MNINIYKENQNEEYSQILNDKKYSKNKPGKIKEKFILLNEEKTIRKENKIKDLGISVKNSTASQINMIVPKTSNNSKVKSAKKTINNEPYLKPTFQMKNKNAISIKNKKKNKNSNNLNEEINNIYLNFFKIYYDENGKKIKIIKNKSNLKKNKSRELLLTQKNINSHKILVNKGNNFNKTKLKKNCETDILDSNTKKIDDNNIIEIKYHYPDTPSQSTTTENKSLAKSKSFVNKAEFINNKKNSLNALNKENIITDLNNNLIKDKINKESNKKFRKKNIVINNTNSSGKIFFKKSPKKLKAELSQGFLMHKLYNNDFNINKSNTNINTKTRERSVDMKNSMKEFIINDNKINYFHNNISNLTLNMTFEENNFTNNINKNPDNSYIKNIHISCLSKKNSEKSQNIYNPFVLNNNLEKVENNNNNEKRNSEGFKQNYLLFNFYKDKINGQSDKSFAFQKAKNFYSNFCSRNNSINEDSLSYNNYNIMRYNISNNLNANTYMAENDNILNKTKEILKMNQHKPNNFNYKNIKNALFSHLKTNFDLSPKSIKFERNNCSTKNMYNNINNKNTMFTPNIDYNLSSKKEKEKEFSQKSQIINLAQFNKLRRPCSLYFNKKCEEKEKINKTNFNLGDYYSCAIDKDSHLNSNISNIHKNPRNIIFQCPNNNKNTFSEVEISNNIKNNNPLKNNKYININQSSSIKQIFNKKLNQKKCCKNQFFVKHSPNSSLKSIPSCLLIKKNNNIN